MVKMEQILLMEKPIVKPSKREEKQFVDQMMYLLTSPVIYMPQWTPPDNMIRDRKIHLLADHTCYEKQESTDYDALIYIQTASMHSPLDSHWFNIFMWLFIRYYEDKAPSEWKEEHRELDIYEKNLLLNLKQWIFRKQIQHIKDKEKKDMETEGENMKQITFEGIFG